VDDATPYVGENVTFTVTVANLGPDDATGVVLDDVLPSGYTFVSANPSVGSYDDGTGVWTIGALADGVSETLEIVATVNATGDYENTASVDRTTATEPDPDDTNNEASVSTTPEPSADIEVTKAVDNATPFVGDNVVFTLTVPNHGPSAATNVTVTDLLPSGYTYVSDNGGGDYVAGTGVWTIGSLANGASASLDITVTVNASGTYLNTALGGADERDPDDTNQEPEQPTTPRVRVTPLVPTVTTAQCDVNTAGTTVWDVVNTPANGSGVSYAASENPVTHLVTVTATPDTGNAFDPLTLPSGWTLQVDGTATWTYTLQSTNCAPAVDPITPTVNAPVCAVGDAGQTIWGTVTLASQTGVSYSQGSLTDNGTGTGSIVVTATADAGVFFDAGNLPAGWSVNPAGTVATYTATVVSEDCAGLVLPLTPTVNAPVCAVGDAGQTIWGTVTLPTNGGGLSYSQAARVGNTVTVTVTTDTGVFLDTAAATAAGWTVAGDAQSATIDVTVDSLVCSNEADLEVLKTVNNMTPSVGGTIVFSLLATNHGPIDATGVVVTDHLPTGYTYVSATASKGSYSPATSVWSIGSLPVGASELLDITVTVNNSGVYLNSASIDGDQVDPVTPNDSDNVAPTPTVVGGTPPQLIPASSPLTLILLGLAMLWLGGIVRRYGN